MIDLRNACLAGAALLGAGFGALDAPAGVIELRATIVVSGDAAAAAPQAIVPGRPPALQPMASSPTWPGLPSGVGEWVVPLRMVPGSEACSTSTVAPPWPGDTVRAATLIAGDPSALAVRRKGRSAWTLRALRAGAHEVRLRVETEQSASSRLRHQQQSIARRHARGLAEGGAVALLGAIAAVWWRPRTKRTRPHQ